MRITCLPLRQYIPATNSRNSCTVRHYQGFTGISHGGKGELLAGVKVMMGILILIFKLQILYNQQGDMDQADGVIVPKSLNYSQELGTTAPLYFVNQSPHTYVFKIRTNQKTALSLHSSHGFLRPHSQLQIPVKIIQKPNPAIPLKLEVNYTLATNQEIDANDSKRAIIGKTDLTKRVILFREGKKNDVGSQKIIQSSQKVVLNHSNEEYSALDNSIKKEQSQNGIDLSQNCPKRLMPKIRTPKKNQEGDQVQHQVASMFRHTFSIDKPLIIEQISLQSDQQVKMNVFTTAKQQNPSPSPSSRDEQFNPFSMLLQSVKNESGITIQSKHMENEKKEEKEEKANIQEIKQQQILQNKPQSLIKYSQQIKNSIIDIKIIQEEKEEMRALERELHELYVRIQCHEDFIKELQSIPLTVPVKRYPKNLFIILSILFFCLGGITKHFAF